MDAAMPFRRADRQETSSTGSVARERPPVLAGAGVELRVGPVGEPQAPLVQEQPQVACLRIAADGGGGV